MLSEDVIISHKLTQCFLHRLADGRGRLQLASLRPVSIPAINISNHQAYHSHTVPHLHSYLLLHPACSGCEQISHGIKHQPSTTLFFGIVANTFVAEIRAYSLMTWSIAAREACMPDPLHDFNTAGTPVVTVAPTCAVGLHTLHIDHTHCSLQFVNTDTSA